MSSKNYSPQILISEQGKALTKKEETLEFLTCYEDHPHKGLISFRGFISSYDSTSWAFMLGCVILVPLSLTLGIHVQRGRNRNKSGTFGAALLMSYGTFLEQGNDLARNVFRYKFAFWICGSWILGAIIVTNLYRGNNITQLTAPRKVETLTKYQELIDRNFILYSFPSDKALVVEYKMTIAWFEKMYGGTGGLSLVGILSSSLINTREPSEKLEYYLTLERMTKIPINYDDISNGRYRYLDLIASCNKTAIVSWSDEIEMKFYELKVAMPDQTISKSQDVSLETFKKGWRFANFGGLIVHRRFEGLIESGIRNEWHEIFRLQKLRNLFVQIARNEVKWKKLTMSDNIVVIFYVFLIGTGLSIIVGLLEPIYNYFGTWRRIF